MTSGTSGFSSGCVFDLETILLNGERHAESIGQRAEDAVLVSLPLYFSFGLVAQALSSLVVGNRLVISGPPFHVGMYREALEDYDVTISSLTPVLIRSLLAARASFPAKMRTLSVGGDALAPDMVGRLLETRPGGELYLTYGLTQAGPRVSTLAAHTEPHRLHSSVGRPIRGTNVFLQPTSDAGGLTELYVKSETVMKRSIGHVEGRPNHSLTAPQTVATGDLFEQDADGYLFFKGRLCDYINRKGEKISLSAVRRLASQLPHVISAKTLVTGRENGHEDFDLVLCLNTSGEALPDPRVALRRLLRQSEMPRNICIEVASEITGHTYK
jgi:acyl-CoA synthetase (AMP-forming)/AMP-acid ligase II